ncbi:flavin-binding monooxygenase-like family protein [Paraphaeosphaeria minitans]|uniref:Flavin-binding monooxygenase-like family protein n=1 Tax=Paraphaeosphaeria minitans TaxID=565426 RepID=A0A9P6G4M2_9PLEO|nr:flavin-binding monooxygenase-like family protein [Paraphaeosphaeria minitans]
MDLSQPANGTSTNSTHPDQATTQAIFEKYEQERLKRIRPEGLDQYIVTPPSTEYEGFYKDIWVDNTATDPGLNAILDNSYHDFLIVGAGYGGLCVAARLIQEGFDVKDIRLVDSAGGFGGTWWYNRYPGLMCDVESYIYMPLLEELSYMPKHKYSYAPELRQHAANIASHYHLHDKALFQARVIDMYWDESQKHWVTKIKHLRPGWEGKILTTQSRFAILAGNSIDWPKLPRISGFEKFKGHAFHTSRWDWSYSGGATAVQVVPQLAKWAQHLYVFQRTPSSVDARNQRATDPDWWNKEHTGKTGWQRERRKNFSSFMGNTEKQPEKDLVDDGMTHMQTYAGIVGNEQAPRSADEAGAYVDMMKNLDLVRQSRIRGRVDGIVQDKQTAEKLKAWYPGWCKRPCFHDEYLQSFNQSNVTLVDTNGKGLDKITENGPFFDGKEYSVDLLVFSTGYNVTVGATPATRLRINLVGANNHTFDTKWIHGMRTLHGVQTNGFPNLFWLGPSQTGATANTVAMIDGCSRHVAFIIGEVIRKYKSKSLTIQPTVEAEGAWTEKILDGSSVFATMGVCPPSYSTAEGDVFRRAEQSPEMKNKMQSTGLWPKGWNDYNRVIDEWRRKQPLEGLQIEQVLN